MAVTMVNQEDIMDKVFAEAGGKAVAIHFWADWAPQCAQMNDVLVALAGANPGVRFAKVEAEAVPELSEKYDISAVPTVVFVRAGKVIDRVDGANVPAVTQKVAALAKAGPVAVTPVPAAGAAAGATTAAPAAAPKEELNVRLGKLVRAAPVMLFMKGTADAPECGFSRRIVAILREHDAEFSTFNILADPEVRAGLKAFSDWPTYPQLYVDGELVGGLDIVKQLAEAGELKDTLPAKDSSKEKLNQRLSALVKRSKVMLFMKGTPDEPRCGFSRTMIGLLRDQQAEFDHYDILGDNEVRQGLKEFSNWPTYPQLYVDGELVGGLDIVKELQAAGELQEALAG